jgi:hypothetical protein
MGHAELATEQIAIDELTTAFVGDDFRLATLVRALVASEAFLTVGTPEAEACTDGSTRACATSCTDGLDVCLDGEWMGCDAPTPRLERCDDGVDDDCDGEIDEGCEPPPEVCNGVDDDLDGQVDEGLEVATTPVSYADLSVAHPSCDATITSFDGPCNAAVHRLCADTDCAVSGYGPVSSSPEVVCLDDTEAVVVSSTFTELSAAHPDCHEGATHGGPCNAAISRVCAGMGLSTGYGPVEHSGDVAVVVCTPNATVIEGSYATLSSYHALCDGSWERWGPSCAAAIHGFCIDEGYVSGHGPLENSGDLAVIACLGAP